MMRSLRPREASVLLSVAFLLTALGGPPPAAAAPDPAPPPPAAAPPPISEADLARRADTVVRGTIVESVAAWNEEHTLIYTHCAIAVADAITGVPVPVVRLRIPGGRVGNEMVWASHSPAMQVGEEFVLFLRSKPETPDTGRYLLCGADAGVLKVANGRIAATGEPIADFKIRIHDLAR